MNGDGNLDIITGHYWPGDIFVFYGEGNGKFAKMDNLKDETGRNLNAGEPWEDENEYRMESLAAAPYAADIDGDGDYDMLIGNIEGSVVLMKNIGDVKKPVFSTERTKLKADGKEIKVAGGDAGPVYEDWNHDGIRDLVVGAGDGSVWFYENTGKNSAPEFAAGKQIVESSGWDAYPHGTVPKKSGVRSKVCVTDYNGDGLVDLLLGDFIYEAAAPLELTAENIKRRDELREKRKEVQKKLRKVSSSDDAKGDKGEQQKVLDEYREISLELGKFESQNIYHGFAWLYLRQPAEQAASK